MLIKIGKVKHNVQLREPHIQSFASYLLLRDYLRKASRKDNNPEWRIWLSFRNRFLKRQLKDRGVLQCYFCGVRPLERNTNNPRKKYPDATIDHIHPQAKGGKKYDEDNLCVACRECNEKKADKDITDFVKKGENVKEEYNNRRNQRYGTTSFRNNEEHSMSNNGSRWSECSDRKLRRGSHYN